MKTLDQIGIDTGTDKSSAINDYLGFYEELFGHMRGDPISILEVGVFRGGSLAMWEQAFPLASVVGVDIKTDQCRRDFERARVIKLDASKKSSLREIGDQFGPFDIVIEDSAHTKPVSQAVIDALFVDYVKPGGWLVIEDISAHWKLYQGRNEFALWAMDVALQTQLGGYMKTTKRSSWVAEATPFQAHLDQVVIRPGIMALRRTR